MILLIGTELGTGDLHINKTWLMREGERGLDKVWDNRLRTLKERRIACAYGEYHKKLHVVGFVGRIGVYQTDHV